MKFKKVFLVFAVSLLIIGFFSFSSHVLQFVPSVKAQGTEPSTVGQVGVPHDWNITLLETPFQAPWTIDAFEYACLNPDVQIYFQAATFYTIDQYAFNINGFWFRNEFERFMEWVNATNKFRTIDYVTSGGNPISVKGNNVSYGKVFDYNKFGDTSRKGWLNYTIGEDEEGFYVKEYLQIDTREQMPTYYSDEYELKDENCFALRSKWNFNQTLTVILTLSNDTEIVWDKTTSFFASEIRYEYAGKTVFRHPQVYAKDDAGNVHYGLYYISFDGAKFWLYKLVSYGWLRNAVYPVVIDPSVVGTSTSYYATASPSQRKSFYAAGRFWVFYYDGANMVYHTSTNGLSWSAAITVRAAYWGSSFSIWFDGTYLHYAYGSGGSIYYRRGTPNADGTITWSAAEQTVSTTYNHVYYPHISVDSNGYVWIGYRDCDGTTHYPYVIKSGYNDGIWGPTPTGFPHQLSTATANCFVSTIPLTSAKMLVVYAYPGGTVRVKQWTGSAWGTEVATSSAIQYGQYHSAVAQGDDVHFVFLKYSPYDILYTKYVYSSNSFGSEVTVKAGATVYSAPVLSMDNSNKLYCFWATGTTGSPPGATVNHIYYQISTDGGSTWSAMTDWIDESAEVLTREDYLTCFYKQYGSYIGLCYLTKTASPYNVKFDFLTGTAPPPPPPPKGTIAVHAKILGVI